MGVGRRPEATSVQLEHLRRVCRTVRRYLMMAHSLDEDEALSLMSVGVDFGITQVADGNRGVHAVLPKQTFPQAPGEPSGGPKAGGPKAGGPKTGGRNC